MQCDEGLFLLRIHIENRSLRLLCFQSLQNLESLEFLSILLVDFQKERGPMKVLFDWMNLVKEI